MIHNMCGPLTGICEFSSHESFVSARLRPHNTFSDKYDAALHLFYSAMTVNNSLIMAYHYSHNYQGLLYFYRSLFFP
jgi:hypothetical protein